MAHLEGNNSHSPLCVSEKSVAGLQCPLFAENQEMRGLVVWVYPVWTEFTAPLNSIHFEEEVHPGNDGSCSNSANEKPLWAALIFYKVIRLCFV